MNRSESRIAIMTILYQVFMYQNNNISYDINKVVKDNVKTDNDFIIDIVNGVLEKKEELYDISNKYLKGWTISRLGLPDQAILCMGIYELLYTSTPHAIVINEAVELAKKYSDDKVKNMINGVLDKVSHEKN